MRFFSSQHFLLTPLHVVMHRRPGTLMVPATMTVRSCATSMLASMQRRRHAISVATCHGGKRRSLCRTTVEGAGVKKHLLFVRETLSSLNFLSDTGPMRSVLPAIRTGCPHPRFLCALGRQAGILQGGPSTWIPPGPGASPMHSQNGRSASFSAIRIVKNAFWTEKHSPEISEGDGHGAHCQGLGR